MNLFNVSVFLVFLFSTVGAEFDYDGWLQLRLWHSFADDSEPKFVERGNITISSIRNENAIVAQSGLDDDQIKQLVNLAKNDKKYKLKINVKTSRGSDTTFYTAVLASQLLGSGLEDHLNVWLDSSGEPVAINLVSQAPFKYDEPPSKMFMTSVHIKYPDAGPIPDTATYIQKLEREKEAREKGETKDNRSFFAKYWMYIIPGVLIVILSSATNPEAGGPGAGAAPRQ